MIGISSKVEYKDVGGGGSFTALPGVRSASFPTLTITAIDNVHLGSPDHAMSYEPGMIDMDSVTLEVIHSASTYQLLYGMARQTKSWQFSDPDGDDTIHMQCDGFITNIGLPLAVGDLMVIQVTIKMTGKATITS